MSAHAGELRGDRHEDAIISDVVFALEQGKPLEINLSPFGLEPIEDLIEEPETMPRHQRGKQQQPLAVSMQ